MTKGYGVKGGGFGRKLVLAAVLAAFMICGSVGGALAKSKSMVQVGVLDDPKTVNVWLASDVWSHHVLRLIYSTLYTHDPKTLELTPWLAEAPAEYDPKTLSYTIKLRPAKWSDGSEFTAEDVVFTGNFVKEFNVPRFGSKWKFVSKIEALDKHTVRFTLEKPNAIFLTITLATPMVQKKQWEKIAAKARKAKKPLAALLQAKIDNPIGTGPFMLAKWQKGVFLYLARNPHFFGQGKTLAGHKLGPFVKGVMFKVFGTTDAAILALRKGTIDMYWNDIQAGYMSDLVKDPDIKIFSSKKSALYYLGFNLRKKPFSDKAFRKAVAYLVDKPFIIKRVLQGGGQPMCSVVPPGNTFYYNPNVEKYGENLTRDQRVKAAHDLLKAAGYSWEKSPVDADGNVDLPGKGLMDPSGAPIEPFNILTPPADYDPNRAMAGTLVQEWLRQAGLPARARPMAFGALIDQIKGKRDFDMFVLGYGRLNLDPGYMRPFFHSNQDKPRGWNMSGYNNAAYDKLSVRSDGEMNPQKRREMIHEMQKIIAEDVPYFPLYNPLLEEGVRADRFTGWVPMLEGIGNIWSFCEIKPVK